MTLGANTALAATGENAIIATNGAINSDNSARNLTVNATGAKAAIVVNGALGNTASLGNVSVSANAIQLKGSSVNTTTDQSFSGAVTLGRDITLQSSGTNSTLTVVRKTKMKMIMAHESFSSTRSIDLPDNSRTIVNARTP